MADAKRLFGIDALRGLAVGAMITQHLGFWLFTSEVPFNRLASEHPIYLFSQGLAGAFVAVWLILPGFGLAYSLAFQKGSHLKLVTRGLAIMAIGYAMNLLTPSWFSWGAWFALHQIGFMMALAPLFMNMSSRNLFFSIAAVLAVTAYVQTSLQTPFSIGNIRMRDTSMPGGVLRLIFFEGHFPVFPWAVYFFTGILAGRWFLEGRRDKVLKFGLLLISLSAVLALMYLIKLPVAVDRDFVRLFRFVPRIYPSLLPMTLFELSFGLFLILLISSIEDRYGISPKNPIVSVGHISLTAFCLHILIFRELAVRLGVFRSFNMTVTAVVIPTAYLLFITAAVFWRKSKYKYSLEWLIRRAG